MVRNWGKTVEPELGSALARFVKSTRLTPTETSYGAGLKASANACAFGVPRPVTLSQPTFVCRLLGSLAWKTELARFYSGLLPEEIRSAVLLGLLGFVIYPILRSN